MLVEALGWKTSNIQYWCFQAEKQIKIRERRLGKAEIRSMLGLEKKAHEPVFCLPPNLNLLFSDHPSYYNKVLTCLIHTCVTWFPQKNLFI